MGGAAGVQLAMFNAIKARDFDGMRASYHPDYTYTGPDGIEKKGHAAGVEAIQPYLEAFPDLVMEIRAQHEVGNVSILEIVARGTQTGDLPGIPATGRTIELTGCNVVEVEDGKVYRERDYYDSGSMLQQLGVIPAE